MYISLYVDECEDTDGKLTETFTVGLHETGDSVQVYVLITFVLQWSSFPLALHLPASHILLCPSTNPFFCVSFSPLMSTLEEMSHLFYIIYRITLKFTFWDPPLVDSSRKALKYNTDLMLCNSHISHSLFCAVLCSSILSYSMLCYLFYSMLCCSVCANARKASAAW